MAWVGEDGQPHCRAARRVHPSDLYVCFENTARTGGPPSAKIKGFFDLCGLLMLQEHLPGREGSGIYLRYYYGGV